MTMKEHVLITGGAGFLGSHFVNHVVPKYPQMDFLVIDKLNYASGFNTHLIKVGGYSNYEFIEFDLSKDFNKLLEIVESHHITQVINFAAESCVDKSFKDPIFFTMNNILSTQYLLECCRLVEWEIKFLHISTDEVYGEQKETVDEKGILNPTNPYAATKASCDLIIQSYIYSYKLPISIIRSNNVYGLGQYPEKIIPMVIDVLNKRLKGGDDKIPIHGDGHYKRTYLYISDFLKGVELIWGKQMNGECFGEVYNICGDDDYEVSNLELIKLICGNFEIDYRECIEFVDDRNYNDSRYLLNCDKIKQLGWEPKIGLRLGLSKIIQSI
ncbi:unnamed protein product [Wickerhamomyces anomalus]